MRKLNITPITNAAAMPMKSGTLQHLQDAYYEAISNVVNSSIIPGSQYSTNKGYILWGCENSGTGTTYNISAGAVFFNGEVYQVDAVTFSTSGGNVAIGVITTSYYTGNGVNADPVSFTDGNTHNIHEIRKIVFQSGLSGSGAFDYANAFDIRTKPQGCIGQIINIQLNTSDISSNFDSTGLGTSERFKGWAIANGNNGTYNMKGRVGVGYDSTDPTFNALGATGGTKTHLLTAAESGLRDHNHFISTSGGDDPDPANSIRRSSSSSDGYSNGPAGGPSLISTVAGGPQNASSAHNNLQPYAVLLMIVRIY